PARRGHRLGAGIADRADNVGSVAIERLEDRAAAGRAVERFQDLVRKEGFPVERLLVAGALPLIALFTAGDLVGDQAVAALPETRGESAQPGEMVWPEIGEAHGQDHRVGLPEDNKTAPGDRPGRAPWEKEPSFDPHHMTTTIGKVV